MTDQPQRVDGWESRLLSYIESRSETEFAWGVHDCCAFTAGALLAMTEFDAMRDHDRYDNALGAERVIRLAGGIQRIPEIAGLERLASSKMAIRGDVVAIEIDGRTSLGVCCGEVSFFASKIGTTTKPTLDCVAAWRVE